MRAVILAFLCLALVGLVSPLAIPLATPLATPFAIQPAMAVTPEEMLGDPAAEERARNISKQVRCLVCQNQSIDDSDADLARDLRVEIRRQITTGVSDDEILANLRTTYGDYVLLNPPVSNGTYVLWGAPVIIILVGLGILIGNRRQMRAAPHTIEATPRHDAAHHEPFDAPAEVKKPSRLFTGIIICGVIGVSLLLYLMLGRADLPDQPLASRTAEITATAKLQSAQQDAQQQALASARAEVTADPDNIGAWLRLAFAANQALEHPTEIAALEQALAISKDDPSIKAMLAEALSRAAEGQITMPARQLITEALIANPEEPRALYIAGLAAYQDEDFTKAVSLWRRLESLSAADAPWMSYLGDSIQDAMQKAGPSGEDIAAAAALDSDERMAMIEGMVAGLAERLKDEPEDVDGWNRLARAYDVLGRPQQSATALISAADASINDKKTQITALEYIIANGFEDDFAAQSTRLLTRLDEISPEGLERLFFRGHFARHTGDNAAAKKYWQSLLDILPDDTPFVSDLAAAIADL